MIVVVNIDEEGAGGVERFCRSFRSAAEYENLQVRVLNLSRIGYWHSVERIRLSLMLIASIVRRPQAVVFTHINVARLSFICRLFRVPYYVVCHGREVWRPLSRSLVLALREADEIWPVSRFTRDELIAMNPTVRDCDFRILPLMPDPAFVPDSLARSPERRGRQVLTVARLVETEAYKGVDFLLLSWPAVLEEVPDAQLIVVGDGPHRGHLEGLLDRDAVGSSVSFRGRVSDQDLRTLYAESTCFCLPGRLERDVEGRGCGEGFGIVFLEASAAGTPVIGGVAGGSSEAVVQAVTGFSINGESIDEISGSITRLLLNPDLCRRFGENGRKFVNEEHSLEVLSSFVGNLRRRSGG